MKVIDLLNMIANGDKLPDRVYFWDREYVLDKEYNCYLHQIDGNKFIDLLDNNNDDLQCFLNDNIKCIKPVKKLDKIKRFIIENCVASNEWTELENHTMIPTGNITYKTMSRKKVEELMEMIRR